MPLARRIAALALVALGAVAASAEAAELLVVPRESGQGTVAGRVQDGYLASSPCWRPDGSLTALVESAPWRPRYGTFRPGAAPRLRPSRGELLFSAFSPGCELVAEEHYAFEGDDATSERTKILDVGTGGVRTLAHAPGGSGPAWSPDGSRIALHESSSIAVVDPVTGRGVRVHDAGHSVEGLTWAPDGRTLAAILGDETSDGRPIHALGLVNAVPGGRLRRVTALRQDWMHAPVWSPDGTPVAVGR